MLQDKRQVGDGGIYSRFIRTDVHASVEHARETDPALVVRRRRRESRVAGIDRRAVCKQRVGQCGLSQAYGSAAVILQRAEEGVGVGCVAGGIEAAA